MSIINDIRASLDQDQLDTTSSIVDKNIDLSGNILNRSGKLFDRLEASEVEVKQLDVETRVSGLADFCDGDLALKSKIRCKSWIRRIQVG